MNILETPWFTRYQGSNGNCRCILLRRAPHPRFGNQRALLPDSRQHFPNSPMWILGLFDNNRRVTSWLYLLIQSILSKRRLSKQTHRLVVDFLGKLTPPYDILGPLSITTSDTMMTSCAVHTSLTGCTHKTRGTTNTRLATLTLPTIPTIRTFDTRRTF